MTPHLASGDRNMAPIVSTWAASRDSCAIPQLIGHLANCSRELIVKFEKITTSVQGT